MNKHEIMTKTSIPKLLVKFSVPAIVGMLVNALYNLVDGIFVGNGVGDKALAGVTINLPIIIIMLGATLLVGMGATSLISIRFGQNRVKEAEKIAGNAMVLLVVLSFFLSALIYIFNKQLLRLFGASAEIMPYASDYLKTLMPGMVLMSIGTGMNNFIRAEGNPKIAMFTMLIGAATNIVLDYVFIFHFHWGVKGAAFATVISYAVTAAWVLRYLTGKKSQLKLRFSNLKLNKAVVKSMLITGIPAFALQTMNSIQQLIIMRSLSAYGSDHLAIAAMGIVMSVSSVLVMPIIGISQGAQPIIGYNYGAEQIKRVKQTLKLALFFATLLLVIGYVFLRLFASKIVALFNQNPDLIALGKHAILTFFLLLPLVGIQIISGSYFQAVNKPRQATVINLSRQVILFIPLLLILPRFWGLDGIWRAAPFADLGSLIMAGTWLIFEIRGLKRLEKAQQADKTPLDTLSKIQPLPEEEHSYRKKVI